MDRRTRFPLLASAIGAALLSSSAVLARPNPPPPPAPSPRPGNSMPAMHLTEAAKIEALIGSIEQLRGAVFIRNGSEYDGAKAAAHLRRKLDYAGSKVKTAEQFIDYLATGSSMSGKPYKIRFADGHSVESAVYFREQLRRIESPPEKTAKG
jgi:hypothetical protein